MQSLLDAGVSTRRGIMNAHQEAAYAATGAARRALLQESEAARDAVVLLPLYHDMTEQDQDRVVEPLRRLAASPAMARQHQRGLA
jgi:dTDP-4-amino-4,6-dideoxygalactose transaminase